MKSETYPDFSAEGAEQHEARRAEVIPAAGEQSHQRGRIEYPVALGVGVGVGVGIGFKKLDTDTDPDGSDFALSLEQESQGSEANPQKRIG